MTENIIKDPASSAFDRIKQLSESYVEFWYARDLYPILGYTRWEGFLSVIKRAEKACENSKIPIKNHFHHLTKMVSLGYGTQRKVEDVALTRFACYLIVQNGDPSKETIAQGQAYFALQTRKQELTEQADPLKDLTEDQKRIVLRESMREHNKDLANAAHDAGVVKPYDYAIFQNFGYKGLYNGLTQKDIRERKGLSEKKFLILWALKNWLLIYFGQRKQKKN